MKTPTQILVLTCAVASGICWTDSAIGQIYLNERQIYEPRNLNAWAGASASAAVDLYADRGPGYRGQGAIRVSARVSASAFSGISDSETSRRKVSPEKMRSPGEGPYSSPGRVKTSRSGNRRISVTEDGKEIYIAENAAGITVSVDGKRVRGKDVNDLRKRSPDAYRLYHDYLGNGMNDNHLEAANGLAKADGNVPSEPAALLREELNKMRDEHADQPQLKSLIDTMLRNVPQ